MKKFEEINELLVEHLTTNDDTAYTDRGLLVKLRELMEAALDDERTKPVTEGTEQAMPSNVYQAVMATMTPEKLANLGVKLIYVNDMELFWVTSVGKLYNFNAYKAALDAEYEWLMSETN